MKRGALFLLFIIYKLIVNKVVCEPKNGSNNVAIIETPVNNEDLQKNLIKYVAEDTKHQVEKLEDNTVLPPSPYAGLPFTIGQLVGPLNGFSLNDMDISNDTPDKYTLLNDDSIVKPRRKQRSDEDIREQLEHDAIMNNILPTMDESFFRDASLVPEPEVPLPSTDLMAYFPTSYGAPVALYLQCTPKITRGYQQNLLQDYQVPLPYYNRETVWQEPVMLNEYKK